MGWVATEQPDPDFKPLRILLRDPDHCPGCGGQDVEAWRTTRRRIRAKCVKCGDDSYFPPNDPYGTFFELDSKGRPRKDKRSILTPEAEQVVRVRNGGRCVWHVNSRFETASDSPLEQIKRGREDLVIKQTQLDFGQPTVSGMPLRDRADGLVLSVYDLADQRKLVPRDLDHVFGKVLRDEMRDAWAEDEKYNRAIEYAADQYWVLPACDDCNQRRRKEGLEPPRFLLTIYIRYIWGNDLFRTDPHDRNPANESAGLKAFSDAVLAAHRHLARKRAAG